MRKEDFLKLGLSDELAEKAASASAEELKSYVPRGDFDTKVRELETANTSVSDLGERLKAFDGVDVKKLKDDVAAWEKKYNADMAAVKKDAAVDIAILKAGGRNAKAIKALLDMDKINLKDDGSIEGLDMEGLKKSDGYLFNIESTGIEGTGKPKEGEPQGGDTLKGFISAARAAAGLKN